MEHVEEELEYRAVLAVDIEHSAGRGNMAFFTAREALRSALRGAFTVAGVDWGACRCDDLGDGFRVAAPPGTPKTRLLHPLTHDLASRLRAHNRTAGEATRVRVRAALHAGDVRLGPGGEVTGRPLEVLARMLDADAARDALARAPSSVTACVLVSQHVYEDTVLHGYPGIDPESFRRVPLTVKEYTAEGWLHLPGLPVGGPEERGGGPEERGGDSPPGPASDAVTDASSGPASVDAGPDDEGPGGAARPAPTSARGGDFGADHAPAPPPDQPGGRSQMVNTARDHGVVYATQNGTQHIHLARET